MDIKNVQTNDTTAAKAKLPKSARLRHTRLVDDLFAHGRSLYDFPLRMTWRRLDRDELESSFRGELPPRIGTVQMLVTVPKKKLRHAVDRVLIRRRIREAYRLNNHMLREVTDTTPDHGTLSVAFVYMHNGKTDYALIERKMCRLLRKLAAELQSK